MGWFIGVLLLCFVSLWLSFALGDIVRGVVRLEQVELRLPVVLLLLSIGLIATGSW